MPPVSRRRRYDRSNRERQARETRRRIVAAAARLFDRDGYAGTSIAAIAEEAQVAVPTVYASLHSKSGILRAVVELTVRGDDGDAPLASRAVWQEMENEPDARARIALFARLHRQICEREAGVFAQLAAAAGSDEEATALLAEHDSRRYQTQERLARDLDRRNQLRPSLTTREAADVVWTLASERTYLALVRDREWKPGDYERWLTEQLVAALLPRSELQVASARGNPSRPSTPSLR
jgi:TetR/AcrR family transcriptional regulator of autoinduction and epiphytic fitness